MFGTILMFIKFNNFDTRCLNGSRCLFLSFCCTTRHVFEPLRVFEAGFNMDKYGNFVESTVIGYKHAYSIKLIEPVCVLKLCVIPVAMLSVKH